MRTASYLPTTSSSGISIYMLVRGGRLVPVRAGQIRANILNYSVQKMMFLSIQLNGAQYER